MIALTARPTNTFLARAVVSTVVAVAANLGIWLIGDAALDPMLVPAGGDATRLDAAAVVVATAVGIALATLVALAARRSQRPRHLFLAAVAVGTVLSLGGPLSGDLDAANTAALTGMHLVTGTVAAIGIGALLPLHRSPTTARSHP